MDHSLKRAALMLTLGSSSFDAKSDPSRHELWNECVRAFEQLEIPIRESIQRAATPLRKTQSTTAQHIIQPRVSARVATPPAPTHANYGSEQSQYQPALKDDDVISALLQLHDQSQEAKNLARQSVAALGRHMEQQAIPRVQTEAGGGETTIRYSREKQPLGSSYSPILKPVRRS